VQYLRQEDILPRLKKIVRPGDTVLTLGAGDIYRVGEELLEFLKNSSGASHLTEVGK
jgi:UDP-N-acetylmuramate--alanine ligase